MFQHLHRGGEVPSPKEGLPVVPIHIAVAVIGGFFNIQNILVQPLCLFIDAAVLADGYPDTGVFHHRLAFLQRLEQRGGPLRPADAVSLRRKGLHPLRVQIQRIPIHIQNAGEVYGGKHISMGALFGKQRIFHRAARRVGDGESREVIRGRNVDDRFQNAGLLRFRGIHRQQNIAVGALLRQLHVLRQLSQAAREHVIRHLGQPGVVILHMPVNLVAGTAAYAVVRVVLHQVFPHVPEMIERVALRRGAIELQHGVQRLQPAFQHVLRADVGRLQVAAGGQRPFEERQVAAVTQLPLIGLQGNLVFLNIRLHLTDIRLHMVLPHRVILLQRVQNGKKVVLGLQMIHTVHQQQIRGDRHPFELLFHTVQQQLRYLDVFGKALGVVIPERHMYRQNPAAVGALPDKLRRGGFGDHFPLRPHLVIRQPPAENEIVQAEIVQDLRQLRDVAELIRRIAHLAAAYDDDLHASSSPPEGAAVCLFSSRAAENSAPSISICPDIYSHSSTTITVAMEPYSTE